MERVLGLASYDGTPLYPNEYVYVAFKNEYLCSIIILLAWILIF
jgi:hypothetical protein